jgi:asparagine synthase (glutamine-hydrolysing)
VLRRRLDVDFPWLRPEALKRVLDLSAAEDATEPFGWSKSFRWWHSLRYWQAAQRSLDVLAADVDVRIGHPFAEPAFSAALAALPASMRFRDRAEAMAMLVGDWLPATLIGRTGKASFDAAFFNVHSRALTATWQGQGVDPEHVEAASLREHWRSPHPDGRSFLLLQSVWLARERAASAATEFTGIR